MAEKNAPVSRGERTFEIVLETNTLTALDAALLMGEGGRSKSTLLRWFREGVASDVPRDSDFVGARQFTLEDLERIAQSAGVPLRDEGQKRTKKGRLTVRIRR